MVRSGPSTRAQVTVQIHSALPLLVLALPACSKATVTGTTWDDDSPASSISRQDGALDGPFRLHHPGGAPHVETNYARGLRQGAYREWFPGGQLAVTGQYDQGLRVGEWTEFTEDGWPTSRGTYVSGDKDGRWILHDAQGRPTTVEVWESGTRLRREATDAGG